MCFQNCNSEVNWEGKTHMEGKGIKWSPTGKEGKWNLQLPLHSCMGWVVSGEMLFLSWSVWQCLLSQPKWRQDSRGSPKTTMAGCALSFPSLLPNLEWAFAHFWLFFKFYLLFKVSSNSTSALRTPHSQCFLSFFKLLPLMSNALIIKIL